MMTIFLAGQISIDIAVYNERLAIILGFISLLFVLEVFFTCRSCTAFLSRIGLKKITSNKIFLSLFKYHSFFWWGLIFSLVLHLSVAVMHLNYNDPFDPDAYWHPYIFASGLGALSLTLIIYFSCRSFAGILLLFKGKRHLSKNYGGFYHLHSYLWILIFAIVIIHFTLGYLHTGIWVY
jgi:hypothetical protein